MFQYRITKYNPLHRDQNDVYLLDEWTSISDIDEVYLTTKEYEEIENAYVNAICYFLVECGVKKLKITDLEKHEIPSEISNEMQSLYHSIQDNDILQSYEIRQVSKLVLRESIWCKLNDNENFFVHFGFDYYMYIGCTIKCENAIERITTSGLFIENKESPYKQT